MGKVKRDRVCYTPSSYGTKISKHPAHFCVLGCKEMGLTYGESINSSGNDNNAFAFVQLRK